MKRCHLQPCKYSDRSSQKRQNETCGLKGFPATLEISEMLKIIDILMKATTDWLHDPFIPFRAKLLTKESHTKAVLHSDCIAFSQDPLLGTN